MDNNDILLFLKFGEEKYLKRLIEGNIYFSNAEVFRNIEKEKNIKGQGDIYEAILRLFNGRAKIDSGMILRNTNIDLGFQELSSVPIFSIMEIRDSDCAIRVVNGKRILKIKEELKAFICRDFPKADSVCVFYEPQNFIDSMGILGGLDCRSVYYEELNKMISVEMIKDICMNEGTLIGTERNPLYAQMKVVIHGEKTETLYLTKMNIYRLLFWKDLYFKAQREYRFVLKNEKISSPKEFKVCFGNQRKKIFKINEFFSGIEL